MISGSEHVEEVVGLQLDRPAASVTELADAIPILNGEVASSALNTYLVADEVDSENVEGSAGRQPVVGWTAVEGSLRDVALRLLK